MSNAKIALVIGTSTKNVPSAAQEAKKVASALEKLSFDLVEVATDPDVHKLQFAIEKVNSKMSEYRLDGTDIIYVLYFVGETVNVDALSQTYMTSVDSVTSPPSKVLSIQQMIANFAKYSSFFDNMVAIIDGCGKPMTKVPKNTALVFSERKADATTAPFTNALCQSLRSGTPLSQIVENVGKSVSGQNPSCQSALSNSIKL